MTIIQAAFYLPPIQQDIRINHALISLAISHDKLFDLFLYAVRRTYWSEYDLLASAVPP